MKRRQFNAAIAASAAIPFSRHAAAQARTVLRAGDQKGGLRALLEAADELRNLPYDIQWTEFPAAAPLAEALNAEAVDLGPIGDAPLLFALASGAKIKAFAVSRSDAYGTAVLVLDKSPLKDAASLKGKSVGTNRGSIGHFVTLRALASAGLTGNDVNFRLPPPAQAKLALTAGIGRCMDPPGSLKPHSPGPTVTRVFWSMGAARRAQHLRANSGSLRACSALH